MIDVMRAIAAELAADAGVSAIVGERVRIDEPDRGDADVPFRAFIVLVDFGQFRPEPRVPVQERRVLARLYGATESQVESLYDATAAAWHLIGPRVGAGVGIYQSSDDTDSPMLHDPDTRQPYLEALFSFMATTVAVP